MNEINSFQLDSSGYLSLTPVGALYAVSAATSNGSRDFLLRLLQEKTSPALSAQAIAKLTGLDEQIAIPFLYQLQSTFYIQSLTTCKSALSLSDGYQAILPLLVKLSDEEKVLLLDQRGRILCSNKFSTASGEALADYAQHQFALNDKLLQLRQQHSELDCCGYSLLNWRGYSQISFWPLYWHKHLYTLVISGMPRLNQAALADLIWSLSP